MKKIIKMATVALSALLLASQLLSCGNKNDSDAPLGFKEISNEDVLYDLFVPDEWTPNLSTGVSAAYIIDKNNQPTNISLMAYDLKGNTSIDQYWAATEPALKDMFSDLEYVGEPEQKTLDGVPAVEYVYTASVYTPDNDTSVVNNRRQYKFMQLIAFKDATAYTFTYTATAENYDTHIGEVIDILNNFKFH